MAAISTGLGLAISGIASGAGAVASGMGKKKQTTQATFDPKTEAFRNSLMSQLTKDMNNPLSLDPGLLAQGLGGVNQAYNAAIPGLQSQFSARGLGQSGLFGGSLNNLSVNRMGAIGNIYSQVMGTAQDRRMRLLQMAQGLANPTGSTTTQQGSLASGLGAGLGELGTLFGMQYILGQLNGGSNKSLTAGGTTGLTQGVQNDLGAWFGQ